MSYNYILFDLDGTLTDPEEGITNAVAYALKRFNINVENKKTLRPFIGPPLFESFEKYYGFSKDEAIRAVEIYREYFSEKGIYENRVYEGIAELLSSLKNSGKHLAVASSKPEVFVKRVLEHFSLDSYFEVVVGSFLNGDRINKSDVIKEALSLLNWPPKEEIIMVGDRHHDICGAKENNIKSVGVLYGFGTRTEFTEAKADFIAENIENLKEILEN